MKFICDFHIHSKYSRAVSRLMDFENISQWMKKKGVQVLGTGDFTHPQWFKEIKEKLEPAEPGLFKLKDKEDEERFILTVEVSCIYSKNKKIRKVHILIFAPSLQDATKINFELGKVGNLAADGRPILGLDAKELTKIVLHTSPDCFVVPAHCWTPWFSVFGSKSGFDSIEECFEDYSKYIYAGETGLSADPKMFWRVSSLDKIALISNSDSHSLQKIAREANVFDTELNYFSIIEAIKKKDKEKFLYTIEFFPEEGKYHYDGHKNCNVSLSPKESKKYNNLCPRCGLPLVIGVLNRVEELADREENFIPKDVIPFKSVIPLEEIIAEGLGFGESSQEVKKHYETLIQNLKNEFYVLLEAPFEEIKRYSLPEIAEGIKRMRERRVLVEPGYDGVYGKIRIFSKEEKKDKSFFQKTLF